MIYATQIRPGMVINYEGDLYSVMSTVHKTPGNLRGFVQVKMRSLKTGVATENRFASDDRVEKAALDSVEMEYLYTDGQHYYFMNSQNYEQVLFDAEMLGDTVKYLLPNTKVFVDLYEEKPVGVELPSTVPLKVVEVEPTVKRATASASFKAATLETGMIVRVPNFVQAGDIVKIDTETGEYLERA